MKMKYCFWRTADCVVRNGCVCGSIIMKFHSYSNQLKGPRNGKIDNICKFAKRIFCIEIIRYTQCGILPYILAKLKNVQHSGFDFWLNSILILFLWWLSFEFGLLHKTICIPKKSIEYDGLRMCGAYNVWLL